MTATSKIYLPQNVLEATRDRLRRLYDEFEVVLVNFSGGKDSTVLLQLCFEISAEKGRGPVPVFFMDEECEWNVVVEFIRETMNDPRVEPYWFQGQFRESLAGSDGEDYLYCWKEGGEWMRPKEPNSIHTNETKADLFEMMYEAFVTWKWPTQTVAQLAGVRGEESPNRLLGLTGSAIYKDITWGNMHSVKGHYSFYPLYDWGTRDIWKAIYEHEWPYCPLYDLMYQHGLPVQKMRVSSLTHEMAINSLTFMQELEPETWNKLQERFASVHGVQQMHALYIGTGELPKMFRTWKEYRDYLLEKLIAEDEKRDHFAKVFARDEHKFKEEWQDWLYMAQIRVILVNDVSFTTLKQFRAANLHGMKNWRGKQRAA